jgi:hypothetical protein|mmetsp:Transcript_93915/g.251354  ORF Transcript_93915/g.251354 Transcript_93915/m.251354 type:complete len:90 (-) Transcript_93915:103-372(-)
MVVGPPQDNGTREEGNGQVMRSLTSAVIDARMLFVNERYGRTLEAKVRHLGRVGQNAALSEPVNGTRARADVLFGFAKEGSTQKLSYYA